MRVMCVQARLLLLVLLVMILAGCSSPQTGELPSAQSITVAEAQSQEIVLSEKEAAVDKQGVYTRKEDVALYLKTYGHLPGNFITKVQARALGWTGGDLRPYAQQACIGGDRFGNYEGLLPDKKGRIWYECDIDTLGRGNRGARRIVYSSDGLIYYTEDHYASFVQLFGGAL